MILVSCVFPVILRLYDRCVCRGRVVHCSDETLVVIRASIASDRLGTLPRWLARPSERLFDSLPIVRPAVTDAYVAVEIIRFRFYLSNYSLLSSSLVAKPIARMAESGEHVRARFRISVTIRVVSSLLRGYRYRFHLPNLEHR